MDLSVANYKKQGGGGGGGGGVSEVREYRKGNWTVEETMVLIEAKKMDEERRMKRVSHGGERGKPAELRWKWVEDYCWRRRCCRSQNQCNDKWDNLMRDFKKLREYEGMRAAAVESSYWRIEKNERREKNLPSNFSPEIYGALVELTERKSTQRFAASVLGQPSMPPHDHPLQQPPVTQTAAPPTHPPPTEQPNLAFSQAPLPTVDSDDTSDESSEQSPAAAKRRKREGTSGRASGTAVRLEEVGIAISKSASIIAEAIQSCDEREERREREMMSLHERRLKIEESKAEINRRGINSLVDAVNKLADSIYALAHHHTNQQHSSK